MRRTAVGVGLVMLVAAGNVGPAHAQFRSRLTSPPPAVPVVPPGVPNVSAPVGGNGCVVPAVPRYPEPNSDSVMP